MAQFISMSKRNLLALVNGGQAVAGNIYFAADTQETFLCITGSPNPGLFPVTSLILSGQYELAGPPSTVPGPQGEEGEQGPPTPLAQQIALTIALG
jgi:hypothetical protein